MSNWYNKANKSAKTRIKKKNGYKVRSGQFNSPCNRQNSVVGKVPDTGIVE